jgi:hypothetical protein
MKTNRIKSFFRRIPSWALALIILLGEFFIFSFFPFRLVDIVPGKISEIFTFILYVLINVICCFFIVRQNPKSIWYVPLIINSVLIMAVLGEINFRRPSIWIPVFCGFVLSIGASIMGLRARKRHTIFNRS